MATGRIKELMDVFVASMKVNVMQVSLHFGETKLRKGMYIYNYIVAKILLTYNTLSRTI